MARRRDLLAKICSMAQAERNVTARRVLSPRLSGQSIVVQLAGIRCVLRVRARFEGWGVFRPLDWRTAVFDRRADAAERDAYLAMFPAVRLVVLDDSRAVLAGDDPRFTVAGDIPIGLGDSLEPLDAVVCRCDGRQFWYDRHDIRRTAVAEELRARMAADLPPDVSGATTREKAAFVLLREHRKKRAAAERLATTEGRLSSAVEHAGGRLVSYIDKGNSYTVEYVVDGQTHRSVVDRHLRVQAAGICLEGRDADFDLSSLVGVLREGHRRQLIYRVGENRD